MLLKKNKKDNGIKVFIRKETGSITNEEFEQCDKEVDDMKDNIPISERAPGFFSSIWSGGYWIVNCSDVYAKNWLKRMIPLLSCSKNSRLKFFVNKNLPLFEVDVTLSKRDTNDSDAIILSRLQRNDLKLNTSLWKIVERSQIQKNEGPKLRFAIDLDSIEKIKKNKCKVFYRMGMVKFTLHDKVRRTIRLKNKKK